MRKITSDRLMTPEASAAFLASETVGRLSTLNSDGTIYTIPLHYIFMDGKIYFHSSPEGQKMENLRSDSRCSFEIDSFGGYIIRSENPCRIGSIYKSATVVGSAKILENTAEKKRILSALLAKAIPDKTFAEIPDQAAAATAIVEITIAQMTGKACPE